MKEKKNINRVKCDIYFLCSKFSFMRNLLLLLPLFVPEWTDKQARPLLTRGLADGNYEELVDRFLESNYDSQEMARMVACAAASIRHSAKRRPKMSQVYAAPPPPSAKLLLHRNTVYAFKQYEILKSPVPKMDKAPHKSKIVKKIKIKSKYNTRHTTMMRGGVRLVRPKANGDPLLSCPIRGLPRS